MTYDVIIGLEIHAALKTESKMFCTCPNVSEAPANTVVCPICLGHPGTLPSPNMAAIESTILLGMALGCRINRLSRFDRKQYFYPDLPKGYQISQSELPLAYSGRLRVNDKVISITRLHLEEDTGKLNHPPFEDYSLVDYNRAGTPLVELVTEPIIPDAATAKAFAQRYQQILRYLGLASADIEKGEMRCEANISLQKKGCWQYKDGQIMALGNNKLNNKVEVKNIGSFRSLEKAIDFEINRQTKMLENNEHIKAETRGWNDQKNITIGQRVKESSADYRYFPDPDIPPFKLSPTFLRSIKLRLKELPEAREERFRKEYTLSEEEAILLCADKELSDYYEKVISELGAWVEAQGDSWARHDKKLPKLAANWLLNEYTKLKKIHPEKTTLITPENMAEFILLVYHDKINSSAAQSILEKMFLGGGEPTHIMAEQGLEQLDDEEQLRQTVTKVFAAFPDQTSEYKNGKVSLLQFFIGQVMAETKGKANPQKVKKILEELNT